MLMIRYILGNNKPYLELEGAVRDAFQTVL